jgi:hypothetical protein
MYLQNIEYVIRAGSLLWPRRSRAVLLLPEINPFRLFAPKEPTGNDR